MKKWVKFSITLISMMMLVGIIFWATSAVTEKDSLAIVIEKFGVLGISLAALVAGLNLIIPIHAATFAPLFISAGFSLPTIIIMLAIGTTTADLLSYVLGFFGKNTVEKKYPILYKKIHEFVLNKKIYIIPSIFLYSAFIPFPNEIILLPLGVLGFKIRKIIIPLVIGTIINQAIFTFGFKSVFNLFF